MSKRRNVGWVGTALPVGIVAGWLCGGALNAAPATALGLRARATSGVSEGSLALDIYAQLTHRTVLRPGGLPELSEGVLSGVITDRNTALAALESEFARQGIEVVPDGQRFVRLIPKRIDTSVLSNQLARIKAPPPRDDKRQDSLLPAGVLDFRGVDISQFLQIYAYFDHRMVLRPRWVSSTPVWLRTQTRLSREEVLYALKVALALNGLATVDDGASFVQVVPITEADAVKAQAPQREPDAPRIKPEDAPSLPRVRLSFPVPRPPGMTNSSAPLQPPPPAQVPADIDELVAYYAKLTGQKAEPSELGKEWIGFKPIAPLSKPEMLYAIETTLRLSNLAIVPGASGGIRAGRL